MNAPGDSDASRSGRNPSDAEIERAANLLRDGFLAALPTETVYGLGANALDPNAVAGIFEAKNRPHFDPLIVHLSSADGIEQYARNVPDKARALAREFWPGPLTIVFDKQDLVPDIVTSGLGTVALRVPGSEVTRMVIERAGVPIAAPSANLFGRVSPTTAEHVREQLGDKVSFVLDAGPCIVGVESTVVRIEKGEVYVLRHGGTPIEELERVVGSVRDATTPQDDAPSSPGQLSSHYAPLTPLATSKDDPRLSGRVGLLAFGKVDEAENFVEIEWLSRTGDLREAAANFFAALRTLDAKSLDAILCLPFPDRGLGRALNDRLVRATAKR